MIKLNLSNIQRTNLRVNNMVLFKTPAQEGLIFFNKYFKHVVNKIHHLGKDTNCEMKYIADMKSKVTDLSNNVKCAAGI